MHTPFLISLFTILAAYFFKEKGFLPADSSKILSWLVMHVTFPAQILSSLPSSELNFEYFFLPLISVTFAFLSLGIGLILFRTLPAEYKGLMLMGAIGINIGLFAFPMIKGVYGSQGAQIAALMDTGNVVMIFGLAFMVGDRFSPVSGSHKRGVAGTLKLLGKSVPLLAYMAALALNLLSWELPGVVQSWFTVVGSANQFLVLIVLGVVLNFDWKGHAAKSGLIVLLLLRYLLGLGLGVLVWFFLPGDLLMKKVVILCLILPAGFAVIPYSIQFGYNRSAAGAVVNLTLIISFFLMWALAVLL